MSRFQPAVGQQAFLERSGIDALVRELRQDGYTVLAPVADRGVIALRPIESAQQIASGVRDEQAPGRYRLVEGEAGMFFQYGVGADSPKRLLFPPVQKLFEMHVEGQEFKYDAGPPKPPKLAMIGIRPCELAAIAIQDRHLHHRIAVRGGCVLPPQPGSSSCSSPSTARSRAARASARRWAPARRRPRRYDLAMTELRGGFVVKVGSASGAQIIGRLAVRLPTPSELELAELQNGAGPRAHGPHDGHPGHQGAAGCEHRASAVGRRGRGAAWPAATARWSARPASAARVVDSQRPGRRRGDPHAAVGIVLHAPVHLHHRRAGAQHHPRPLPALAAAQARHLVGPVRHAAAAWAAGGASRGARWAST